MYLNVEMLAKKLKAICESQLNILNLKTVTFVFLEENIKKNVIIVLCVQLNMKCILKK